MSSSLLSLVLCTACCALCAVLCAVCHRVCTCHHRTYVRERRGSSLRVIADADFLLTPTMLVCCVLCAVCCVLWWPPADAVPLHPTCRTGTCFSTLSCCIAFFVSFIIAFLFFFAAQIPDWSTGGLVETPENLVAFFFYTLIVIGIPFSLR